MCAYVQWELDLDEPRDYNPLNFIVFPFLHYFHEAHSSAGSSLRLNAVNVIHSTLLGVV